MIKLESLRSYQRNFGQQTTGYSLLVLTALTPNPGAVKSGIRACIGFHGETSKDS